MLLPIVNVELPSDDWSLRSFKEYKDESTDRAMSFIADFLHKPTGLVVAVENNGRRDMNDYGVCTVTRKKEVSRQVQAEVLQEFDDFCRASIPALIKYDDETRNKNAPWGNMFEDENLTIDFLRDGVFNLFYTDYDEQKRFNRSKGVIYRVADKATGEIRILQNKRATVAQYQKGIDGEYWDKVTKGWVAF